MPVYSHSRGFTRRSVRIWALPVFIACLTLAAPCAAQEYATDAQIKQAIKKAQDYLLENIPQVDAAQAALGTVALLKSGVDPKNKVVAECLEKTAARCRGGFSPHNRHHSNYEATVFLMALANGDPEKYKAEIEMLANWLASAQRSEGMWDYPDANTGGDTSQTQYALLGLWEASLHGVTVDRGVFELAAQWHLKRQSQDGGFAYKPTETAAPASTHSMTAAGVGSLNICRMFLDPSTKDDRSSYRTADGDRQKKKDKQDKNKFGVLEDPTLVEAELEADEEKPKRGPAVPSGNLNLAINRGLRWLDNRYELEKPTGWKWYYYYSLERAMALANVGQYLGEHDWYLEGATHLVETQHESGVWTGRGGRCAPPAFCLMFLSQATAKTLGRRTVERKIPGGLLAGGRGLPKNLEATTIVDGAVKKRKLSGPVDELLAVLEDPKNANFFEAQEALVEKVMIEDPKALVGKTDRLLELATVKNDEVRRTAMWALGRSQDITVVPTLIEALKDPNLDTMVEARNALRFLSKRIDGFGLSNEPTDQEREKAITRWKAWYITVRPYDERDDLLLVD